MSLNIDLPDFNHPEVRVFYEEDLSIAKETVAVEALPTLYKLLKQDDGFNWYWWSDYATEDLWETYYYLANDKLEELKEILLASGDWVHRIIPSTVVEQIFLHQPERQQEILDWYHSVIDAFLKMEDEALDGDLISSIVGDLITTQADEFLPKIRILYERGLVYDGIVGKFESVEADIKNPKYSRKRPLKESIYERYQDAMTWHSYQMKYNEDYQKRHSPKRSSSPIPILNEPALERIVREGKKIGRNEPCPCGSGKKYKKCCLQK